MDAAVAGREHVFFVDAAHFVFGTFLCCLWSIARVFVRAASGRQRFNVLGAWNAVTRELVAVTNTTVVNSETMCELLRAIAARGLVGPVTLVLDNARYQRNALVQGLAKELGIALLFLPSYSPNLNLIERLWRFMKRKAAYGRYHPTFADFRAAIEEVLGGISTTHADKLAILMTLNFQEFEDVSLLAAFEDRLAIRVRTLSAHAAHEQRPPGHDQVQRQARQHPINVLETPPLDATARLQRAEQQLDAPAYTVGFHDLPHLLRRVDRQRRRQKPFHRRFARGGLGSRTSTTFTVTAASWRSKRQGGRRVTVAARTSTTACRVSRF